MSTKLTRGKKHLAQEGAFDRKVPSRGRLLSPFKKAKREAENETSRIFHYPRGRKQPPNTKTNTQTTPPEFQGKTPRLIQLVLTVLVFWSWVLLVPGSQFRLGASDCALCRHLLHGWAFAWSAAHNPSSTCAKRHAQHQFSKGH